MRRKKKVIFLTSAQIKEELEHIKETMKLDMSIVCNRALEFYLKDHMGDDKQIKELSKLNVLFFQHEIQKNQVHMMYFANNFEDRLFTKCKKDLLHFGNLNRHAINEIIRLGKEMFKNLPMKYRRINKLQFYTTLSRYSSSDEVLSEMVFKRIELNRLLKYHNDTSDFMVKKE